MSTDPHRDTARPDAFDGETPPASALVPVGDAAALADALGRYLEAPALRREHGEAGRRRVEAHFSNEVVWGHLFDEMDRLLGRESVAV